MTLGLLEVGRLREELIEAERSLLAAAKDFRVAQAQLLIEGRKYGALRDLAIESFGNLSTVYKPLNESGISPPAGEGLFRYYGMKAGEAVMEVLKESSQPMTLDSIGVRLKQGGFDWPSDPDLRSINAALMKLNGIAKTRDGRYSREPEIDDLPFE